MMHLALRERADRLGRRMEELDRCIDCVTIRSLQYAVIHLFCMFQMVAVPGWPYVTCRFAWMPLSLSLVIFAAYCSYFSSELRRLRRYFAEMKRVRAKLSRARRRLLERCMDHEVSLAEIGFSSTTLTWVKLVCLAVTSAILTCVVIWSVIFTCA